MGPTSEQEARSSGFKGVAAWAMDWEHWNPVSFYEHMGYSRVDQEDKVFVVWKPLTSTTTALYKMALLADNDGNTKPLEGQ